MNNEFKKLSQGDITRYVLEDATGGSTSSSSIASDDSAGFKKGLMVTREGNKKIEPPKPRNFVAKNAKTAGAGAHKDKSKTIPRKEKHKKPFMEDHGDAANKGWGAGSYDTYAGSNHGRGVAEEGDVEQELGMAGSELYGIAKHAKELLALIQQHSDEQGLEAWQQSKITKAADYLNAVLQSIDYDTNGDEQGVAEGQEQTPDQVRQTLNAWMNKDQQFKDPTKRAGFQAKVWPYIQTNINSILSDKGKDGKGGYPAAPYAAWLLVQHMDAYPQNQVKFLQQLGQSGLNPDGKLQFLKDRAAVNQWIASNANKPEYFINGKPLPNPTVNVRNPAMFKDAGIVATSREEALQNAQAAGNKLLVAAVQATNAQTQPSYKQGVAEAGMPSSVVKSKQRYAAMSDKDFYTAHKDKSGDDLRAMAWRHGYGKGSTHYVDKHKKGQQGVAEGAKVDRQAKHITASMMKKGKSKKDAESIAWAHIKHPKKESIDPYVESLSQMLERQLEPTMDLDAWVDNFQNADPNKYHQFKNKTPEKKK